VTHVLSIAVKAVDFFYILNQPACVAQFQLTNQLSVHLSVGEILCHAHCI